VKIGGISCKSAAIYGAINFGAINLLLQKMEQFYGAIIWYHLMAPFYGMCVPGFRKIAMSIAHSSSYRSCDALDGEHQRDDASPVDRVAEDECFCVVQQPSVDDQRCSVQATSHASVSMPSHTDTFCAGSQLSR